MPPEPPVYERAQVGPGTLHTTETGMGTGLMGLGLAGPGMSLMPYGVTPPTNAGR